MGGASTLERVGQRRDTHGHVQQAADSLVVPGAAVRHAHRVHPRPPQDGVLERPDIKVTIHMHLHSQAPHTPLHSPLCL